MGIRTVKQTREVQMDLLRILSMLLIVGIHSIDHSGVLENSANVSSIMRWYIRFGYAMTQVCVNCFVLLSGYFMICSSFKPGKLLGLWLKTVFYTLVIRIAFIAAGLKAISIGAIVSCFLPFLTGRYWFITIYVGMYILAPFINIGIKAMNKKQHGTMNIVLILLFSAWNSIYPGIAGMNSGGGWGLAWFLVLYSLGAWVRLYCPKNYKWNPVHFSYWIIVSFFMATGFVLTENLGFLNKLFAHWYRYDSLFVSTASIALLVFFHGIKVRGQFISKAASLIASSTLGVYLIHAHADLSPWIWGRLDLPQYMNSYAFIPFQIIAIIGIFAGCMVVDIIYEVTIGQIVKQIVCLIGDKSENIGN